MNIFLYISLLGMLILTSNTTVEQAESKNEVKNEVVYQKTSLSQSNTVIPLLPEDVDSLKVKTPNKRKKLPILTLSNHNTLTFRGVVSESTVGTAILRLRKLDSKLPKGAPIYMVLDTPGGSVFDGLDLIDYANALDRPVHTVTLFAASMGFQFAQNLNIRYIQRNGTLMSHRASLSGLGGQLDGEFETRYRMIKKKTDFLDVIAAKRMGISLKSYKSLIINEYWVHGFEAVPDNAADKQVLLKCHKNMKGSTSVAYKTMFGKVNVNYSNCPLIKKPVGIAYGEMSKENRAKAEKLFHKMHFDKETFVRDEIKTNNYKKLFNVK